MKVRIGGPFPIGFEMNGLMLSGILLGAAAVGIWALGYWGVLAPEGRWNDIALGTLLAGIALYFLGRIVDLVARLRRKR